MKLKKISRKVDLIIDSARFEATLDKLLPRPSKDGTPVRKRLRDAQFRQLAQFCSRFGQPQWGLRPRTFAVLRMIGIPEVIKDFVEENLTDIYLPYSEGNLPNFVSGQARLLFLDCQNYVLNGRAAALEKSGGPHQNFNGSADEYFKYVEDLGDGGFGVVDSVSGEMSLASFARKRIKRHRLYSEDKARLQIFENELQILKSLSHQHLVKLVGSYTDSTCVGLIMTPVAEMNLATYLKRGTKNQESRRICLRRFFGCLAKALSYLHSQRIQHKDIKPANILVHQQTQQKVYITDFGTSRSWDADATKTTRGTVPAFTPRYCAPEVVQFGSSRNESRDIWSLGCVFLEMCSVLANFTVEQMSCFFRANGTCREYIRENDVGARAWAEKLKITFDTPQDEQPLDLALRMCTIEPEKRPLATELVSTLFDIKSPPRYYGFCCDEQFSFGKGLEEPILDGNDELEDASTVSLTDETDTASEIEVTWPPRLSYRTPTVEDPTEERTLLAFLHPTGVAQKYVLEDADDSKESDHDNPVGRESDHEDRRKAFSLSPPTEQNPAKESLDISKSPEFPSLNLPRRSLEREALQSTGALSTVQQLDRSQLPCPWPSCSIEVKYHSRENLVTHLRDIHSTHELFWTPLLLESANVAIPQRSGQWVLATTASKLTTSQPSARKVRFDIGGDKSTSASLDSRKSSSTNNSGPTRQPNDRTRDNDKLMPKSALKKTFYGSSDEGRDKQDTEGSDTPFSLLPADRRPELIQSQSTQHEESPQDEQIVSPEPISEPLLMSEREGFRLPKSSLVPSYYLATANHFPLQDAQTNSLDPKPPPLFVYGSLMFPSVLRTLAARLISEEGVYSQALQRRIVTSAGDWAHVNASLEQASRQMTPALLDDHLRVKPMKSRDAALLAVGSHGIDMKAMKMPLKSSIGNTTAMRSNTRGIVIFGLSWEAFACLDYAFHAEETPKRSYVINRGTEKEQSHLYEHNDGYDDSEANSHNKFYAEGPYSFNRKCVRVTVCTINSEPRRILASTYTWQSPRQELRESIPWDINKFVRSKSFQRLTVDKGTLWGWVAEEKQLANKMQIEYAFVGDEICQKAIENDTDGLEALYAEGIDINGHCNHFGTPLQAAAAKGNVTMVYVMLNFMKADPNIRGGKYVYPLIAAISEGHEEIVQMLLRHRADPLAHAGSFVSPIYQAVSFGDVEMARLLLEKGAWLSEDYHELQDVAIEQDNSGLCELLNEYDIRRFRGRPTHRIQNGGEHEEGKGLHSKTNQLKPLEEKRDLTYNPKEKAWLALFKVIQLQGQRGKWTGIKAIRVLHALYPDEVPESTVNSLREGLPTIEKLLFILTPYVAKRRPNTERKKQPHNGRHIKDTTATEDNKVSSLVVPTQRHQDSMSELIVERKGQKNTYKENGEIFCLVCDGRGCRKGTGRACTKCNSTGSVVQPHQTNGVSKPCITKCRTCNGMGNLFSRRDRCRVCNMES